jgi:hypothetical protein
VKNITVISVFCLAAILIMSGCGAKDDKADLRMEAAALTALADNHIVDYLDLLQNLATTPEVQSGDWEQMKDLLDRPSRTRIAALIFFILPDGTSYTPVQGKTNQNLSDRDYFAKLMAGNNVVGTTLVGKISSVKSYLVAVPVIKDGKVIGALGTTPYLDKLSQTLIQEMALESSRIFYALDAGGAVALSSDISQIMAEKPVLSQNVVWQTSQLTGWRFAMGYLTGK